MAQVQISGSLYRVSATHMTEGFDCEVEVYAMDAGEALDKVERHGVFAANGAVLAEQVSA